MIKNRIDGIIIAITKNTTDMTSFQKLKSMGIPVVCIARESQNHSIDYVCTNNVEGAFKATNLLIKKGHRRIGHLMGPKNLHASEERFEGYKKALLKSKIPIDQDLIKPVDFSYAATAKAMKAMMELAASPTGIFAFKNYITLDAIDYLKTAYPDKIDKIDFAGFGNLPLIKYLDHKPLASVEESSYEMGAISARLLFDMINEKISAPKKIEIPCKLVIHGNK